MFLNRPSQRPSASDGRIERILNMIDLPAVSAEDDRYDVKPGLFPGRLRVI